MKETFFSNWLSILRRMFFSKDKRIDQEKKNFSSNGNAEHREKKID